MKTLDYLEDALLEANRAVDARMRPAKVYARFEELWDATMADEIHRSTHTGRARSARWWGRKFRELQYMADRETPHGDSLQIDISGGAR